MRRTTDHPISRHLQAWPIRAAAAALAFAGTLANAAPARAEGTDQDAVLSALETPARGSMQLTGYGDGALDEPARVLGGTVLAAVPVWKPVSFEIAGLGYHESGPGLSSSGATGVGLMAGLRMSAPAGRLRPYATLRIAHLFHATDEHWRAHPIEDITGTAERGLRHPVAAALGAGIEAPIGDPQSPWTPVLDAGVRLVDGLAGSGDLVVSCQLRLPAMGLDLLR